MWEKIKKFLFVILSFGFSLLKNFIIEKYCPQGVNMAKISVKELLNHKRITGDPVYKELVDKIKKDAIDKYKNSAENTLDFLSDPVKDKPAIIDKEMAEKSKDEFLKSIVGDIETKDGK